MEKASIAPAVKTKSQKENRNESFKCLVDKTQEADFDHVFNLTDTWFSPSVNSGFDLSRVPARPRLHTAPGVQGFGKEDSDYSCFECSKTPGNNVVAAPNEETGQQLLPEKQSAVVRVPKSLKHISTQHQNDPTWSYLTYVTYEVLDNSGNPIVGFDVNEKFGSSVYDDPISKWRQGNEGGYHSPTTQFRDMMEGEAVTYKPTPQNPQSPLGTHKVQHWQQEWYIGSLTPGKGTKVQTNTLQKYQDHADHENVTSPS